MVEFAFNSASSLAYFPRLRPSRFEPLLSRRAAPFADVRCVAHCFEQAVRSGFVKDFGRTLLIKSDLSVVETERLCLSNQLESLLPDATTAILQCLGHHQVVTIYIRGSFATQHFFDDGTSDLDLVIVTREQVPIIQLKQLTTRIKSITALWRPLLPVDLRCIKSSLISPSLAVVLRYYALPLYTSTASSAVTSRANLNVSSMAINIREDERKCMAVFSENIHHNNFTPLKLCALQWLCKRCLRCVTELAVSITRKHARDLVPCFILCSSAYPEYVDMFLTALQVACAHEKNGFVGEGRENILTVGLDIVRGLVELVEDLFLKKTYNSDSQSFLSNKMQASAVRPPPIQRGALQCAEELFSNFLFQARGVPVCSGPFARYDLPKIRIGHCAQIEERTSEKNMRVNGNDSKISDVFVDCDQPFIVRGFIEPKDFAVLLASLMRKHLTVTCRISPENVVTFCRSEHPWIKGGLFTPSSVLRSVPTGEAIQRLKESCVLPPLVYKDAVQEHLYIQTDAFRSEALFDNSKSHELQIVQNERIWISAHGTVSSLHYDASHSVLFQRSGMKRMLFFRPECLDKLGIYPRGHPLHRRARISLDYKSSRVFSRFWAECASIAMEAVLQPGDLIVFPPNWSHYTESFAPREQLSVSHTLRYLHGSHF
ncbi:unnamed protein product [Agarophyton chilense]|eukprot:gb/GEZJ01001888.1/.p1 GENE.gb/GEZJ01001888.1/~~gb/GEZJ01001888.1/.p1  ORF type:complete len:658 (-),score=64.42 gb/GEZJ01001888.1/:657-2630(-)